MQLKEGTFIPLYQQMMEDIKRDIEEGTYQPAQKIPTEPELSKLYHVSRITMYTGIFSEEAREGDFRWSCQAATKAGGKRCHELH